MTIEKKAVNLHLLTKTCTICYETKPTSEFSYQRNTCRKCRTEQAKKWRVKNSNNLELYLKSILNAAKSRAKKNTLKFNITYDDILALYTKQKGLCALSGKELTFTKNIGKTYTNISIDRINNKKGYTTGNIQLVCHIVNLMKNTMTTDELQMWCKAILTMKESK